MLFLLLELASSSITEEDYYCMFRLLNSLMLNVPDVDEKLIKNFFQYALKQNNNEFNKKLYETMMQIKYIIKIYNKFIDEFENPKCDDKKESNWIPEITDSSRVITTHYPRKIPLN